MNVPTFGEKSSPHQAWPSQNRRSTEANYLIARYFFKASGKPLRNREGVSPRKSQGGFVNPTLERPRRSFNRFAAGSPIDSNLRTSQPYLPMPLDNGGIASRRLYSASFLRQPATCDYFGSLTYGHSFPISSSTVFPQSFSGRALVNRANTQTIATVIAASTTDLRRALGKDCEPRHAFRICPVFAQFTPSYFMALS
jgi:hypothetical protein